MTDKQELSPELKERARQTEKEHDIRPAGAENMQDPPETCDDVDEELDETFPASDPPANY